MRLRHFTIVNFKAIQRIEFDWDDFLVLIGENNCGKSCVLSALSIFLSGGAIKDTLLFHRHIADEANAIELIGHFDNLTPTELTNPAVQGRTHNGEWILKKKFWQETDNSGGEDKTAWKEQLFTMSAPEVFASWPVPDTSWAAFGSDFTALIPQISGANPRVNAGSRELLKELVRQQRPDLVSYGPATWVPNPGGGGNWKSHANSILPRCVFIKAVQEAAEESLSKDNSTYGKLINLIVENQLAQRQEVIDLQAALKKVLELFSPDANNPDGQAQEIKDLEQKINDGLKEVIGGEAKIRTDSPDVNTMLLPNTNLVIHDRSFDIDTKIAHQGHGLQRTLVITLLQLLAEAQESALGTATDQRAVVLLVEEPELYMHPQMERRMRDLLYRLASQDSFQVACCTHSPVFIDIAERHKAIVRMSKSPAGNVVTKQVSQEIFTGYADDIERQRLQTVARFNPSVNEIFFSNDVVILEEFTAIAAFERAADITGLFSRFPFKKRGVSLVDTVGKGNIPAFQKFLNAFDIPYRVLHDEDRNNATGFAENVKIMSLTGTPPASRPIHLVGPDSIENTLGYVATKSGGKPYAAVKKVEELHALGQLPAAFVQAMNFVYFGTLLEPTAA